VIYRSQVLGANVKDSTITQAAVATEASSVGSLGVEGVHLDTADTLAVDGGDLDVALLTPRGAPGVSDDVVLLATLGTVANSSDGVVKRGTAGGAVEDTTGVHLEDVLVGLDGDGDGGLVNGSLELGDGVSGNVGVAGNLDLLEGLVGLAGTSLAGAGGVGVVRLELLSVGLEVVEGVALPATVATVGGLVARDNLLLREGEEGASLEEVSTLDGAGGGESPAGTASSLVLDGVNGTLGSPVDGVGEVGGIELNNVLGLVVLALVAEELLVLVVSPGGHVVVADGEGVLLGVDLLDLSILDGELLKSELVLLGGTEGDAVLVEMGLEVLLDVGELVVLVAVLGLDTSESGGLAEELHCEGS